MRKKNSLFWTWFKRIVIVLVIITFLVLAFYPAFAEEAENSTLETYELKTDGGTLLYSIVDGEAIITSFSGDLTDVIIPEEVDGTPITKIDNYAFANSSMKSISLPKTITTLGDGVFYFCQSLTKVNFPNTIKDYGAYLFYYCSSLKEFSFPTEIEEIPPYFFYACMKLDNFSLPKSVKKINDYSFYACKSLSKIKLTNSIEIIGNYAFYDCIKLQSIELPESLKTVGDYAFYYCTFNSINIPKNLEKFGIGTVLSCKNLKEIQVDKNNQHYTFKNGFLLSKDESTLICFPEGNHKTSIKIPDGIIKIENEAFSKCYEIESIHFPDSISEIGDYAFAECTAIEKISLPKQLKSIGYDSFYGCEKLKSIVIPDSVQQIGIEAFAECTSLESIKLSSSLEELQDFAFFRCLKIKSIAIPKSLKTLGKGVFIGCKACDKITVDKNNQYFLSENDILFSKDKTELIYYPTAKKLKSYTVGNKIEKISPYAFALNPYLETITLSNNLTYIGERAFQGLNISSIVLPKTLTEIEGGIFAYCQKLTNVLIEKGNSNFIFENGILYNKEKNTIYDYLCTNKNESLKLDLNIAELKDSSFAGNKYLKSITFLNASSSIGSDVFADCSEELVLYSFPQSTAAIYAKNNNLNFAVTGEKLPNTTKTNFVLNDDTSSLKESSWKIVFWITIGLVVFIIIVVIFFILIRKKYKK